MPASSPRPFPAGQLDQTYQHLFQRRPLQHWSGLEDAEGETFLKAAGDSDGRSFPEATQDSDLGPGPLKVGSVHLLSEGLEVGSQSRTPILGILGKEPWG